MNLNQPQPIQIRQHSQHQKFPSTIYNSQTIHNRQKRQTKLNQQKKQKLFVKGKSK
jgi:hypothetical protein